MLACVRVEKVTAGSQSSLKQGDGRRDGCALYAPDRAPAAGGESDLPAPGVEPRCISCFLIDTLTHIS